MLFCANSNLKTYLRYLLGKQQKLNAKDFGTWVYLALSTVIGNIYELLSN